MATTKRNKLNLLYSRLTPGTPVTSEDLASLGISADLAVHYVRAGWLQRLEKGKYLILPLEAGSTGEWSESELVIASVLIQPNYTGLQTALNYYGYSERVADTVYIISTQRKLKSYLDISGVRYQFVTVKQEKFFGYTQLVINEQPVNISDREKTIIDCLDFQNYAGGIIAVARALWYGRRELKFSLLAEYAVQYRRMFSYAQAIIAVSRDMREQLIQTGAPRHKIQVNPCGVDVGIF